MELNSYDSATGRLSFCRLPFRTRTGPPPIAVFAPCKLGDEAVEIVSTAPVSTLETLPLSAGPMDNTMIPGANWVSPDS